ncbi:MAG: hypothetical protein ACREPA_04240 [Candidatus Dormibacteraceae bacterium]
MRDELDEQHRRHLFEGEPDEDLVEALEPDQLVTAMERHVPPIRLGPWARTGLWALRVFLVVVSGLVVYTFVVSIAH